MAGMGRASLASFMLIMLVSGSLNTLLMKFMVVNQVSTSAGAPASGFDHPYFQTLLMMVGEFLCLLVWFSAGKKDRPAEEAPKYVFAVACLFDWTATTLVNMAYMMIAASVVQMTRGAIVIFTCLFSVVFLGRRQYKYHVAGVFLVFVGITLVSLSVFMNPVAATSTTQGPSTAAKIMGISLCVFAQVFQASMLVWEEKILGKYTLEPLQVVGMEGAFGIMFGLILLCFLNVFQVENTREAFYQMEHSVPLTAAVIGSIFSIAFFNYSGVTVTQQASATARSTIDVSRTIIIWAVELLLGWNHFNVLQLMGFIVLAAGTMTYNRLITFKFLEPPEEQQAILKQAEA